jgi:hypothetical protein
LPPGKLATSSHMPKKWLTLDDVAESVFAGYGRTMLDFQRFEFALERLAVQVEARPEGESAYIWIERLRRWPPGRRQRALVLPADLDTEVGWAIEQRNAFAHEGLMFASDEGPPFDPALARMLLAEWAEVAQHVRSLTARLTKRWVEQAGRSRSF